MAGLIPLLIALLLVEHSARQDSAAGNPRLTVLCVVLAIMFWGLTCETVHRLLAARARRRGTAQVTWLWDFAAHALALWLFALLCFGLGWSSLVRGYTLGFMPWVLFQCLYWWCFAAPMRMLNGATWTRTSYLLHQLRVSLLPLVVALPVLDLCAWFAHRTGLETWLFAHFGQMTNVIGGLLTSLVLLYFTPRLLMTVWGLQPLAEGAVRDELSAACQRAGVRVTALLRWPIKGGRVYNAMVVGLMPQMRYVLFTDDLLRDFTSAGRIAVLGHELGHTRHRHLWIYLLFFASTAVISWLVMKPLDDLLLRIPGAVLVDADLRGVLVAIVLVAIQVRLLFGWLSRQCERQADLAGAVLVGEGDVQAGSPAMRHALADVARLERIDPESPSWMHHSIAERMRFLATVAADAGVAARHHRRVRRIVRALAACTCILLALAIVQMGRSS